jgi:hypothetical protein
MVSPPIRKIPEGSRDPELGQFEVDNTNPWPDELENEQLVEWMEIETDKLLEADEDETGDDT